MNDQYLNEKFEIIEKKYQDLESKYLQLKPKLDKVDKSNWRAIEWEIPMLTNHLSYANDKIDEVSNRITKKNETLETQIDEVGNRITRLIHDVIDNLEDRIEELEKRKAINKIVKIVMSND